MTVLEVFWIDPMCGMRSSHDDHIGIYFGIEYFAILQRIVRVQVSIHPEVHENEDNEEGGEKEHLFP
jgi:hypothetical protein